MFLVNDLEAKKPVAELVNGVELWRTNPTTYQPIQDFLEPRPHVTQGYTVPLTFISKMGTR